MMLGDSGWAERSADRYLPYVGHVTKNAVRMTDESALAIFHIPGCSFELEDNADRNKHWRRRNTVLRNLSDDRLIVTGHLVRHNAATPFPLGEFASPFAETLQSKYMALNISGKLRTNDWFLCIVSKPGNAVISLIKRKTSNGVQEDTLRRLEDAAHVVQAAMVEYGARRLGLRPRGGVVYSEIAEALRLILTCEILPVPYIKAPLWNHAYPVLGSSIYTDQIVCDDRRNGPRSFRIEAPSKTRHARIMTFKEYPSPTVAGMFNSLLSAPFPLVMSHYFGFESRNTSGESMRLKLRQMAAAGEAAATQMRDLLDEEDQLASNLAVRGSHNFTLSVYANSEPELNQISSNARSLMVDSGAVTIEERLGMEAAIYSQLPGNSAWRTRPGRCSSRNLASMCSFENFPSGDAKGHWGDPLIRFRTTGGTSYDYVPHVRDVAMTAIFGPIGSGKTLLLMFILAMLDKQVCAEGGVVVFFDKDRGGELLVRAMGGRYLVIQRGQQSGLSPLKGLKNTPSDIDFLATFVRGLIRSGTDYELTGDEDRRLVRGIRRLMKMDPAIRSLAGLREFLSFGKDGAGDRLEKWCAPNGQLAWAFDNDEDLVHLDRSVCGFDLTSILEHALVCPPAAAYLLHRIAAVVDGRRFCLACDEFRFYLLNPMFAAVVDNFLLTARKQNSMVILATQQPEHVLESKLGASLVAQCQTIMLMPSPTADRETYRKLNCTEAEFFQIKEEMCSGPRRFLLKRESGSAVCEFDLSTMPEEIAILSGRTNRIKFVDRLRDELGDHPDAWLPEFRQRYLLEAKD